MRNLLNKYPKTIGSAKNSYTGFLELNLLYLEVILLTKGTY